MCIVPLKLPRYGIGTQHDRVFASSGFYKYVQIPGLRHAPRVIPTEVPTKTAAQRNGLLLNSNQPVTNADPESRLSEVLSLIQHEVASLLKMGYLRDALATLRRYTHIYIYIVRHIESMRGLCRSLFRCQNGDQSVRCPCFS